MTEHRNLTAAFAVLLVMAALACAPQCFASTDFTVPPGRASNPLAMTVGPDKNLWFVETSNQKIGYITTAGKITEFSIPNAQALLGIAAGPDNNMWFTDQLGSYIGRGNTAGGNLQSFPLPAGSHPQGITAGPDGNLWFVEQRQDGFFKIGKITTAGQITEYPVGLNAGTFTPFTLSPAVICAGPDGNLWFVNPQYGSYSGSNLVGKITPSGAVTKYTVGDTPFGITAGPDGNLWVVESNHVAKLTTSGTETEYQLTIAAGLGSITSGPDGNIWFTVNNQVWYVTPAGVATKYRGLRGAGFQYLEGITTGPDGNLWFVGYQSSNIGKLTPVGKNLNVYNLNLGSLPVFMTAGPDGNVWFTDLEVSQVGRITTSGTVTTFNLTPGSLPAGITSCSDGNLWFAEEGTNKVGQMSTSGTLLNEYPTNGVLFYITCGADGNLWFPITNDNTIGRLTTGGVLTEFNVPTQGAGALAINRGPDGNVWFTEGVGNVAKIDPSGNITEYPIPGGASKGLGTIAPGPDGNLWILENTNYGAVAKVSTLGALLAEYPVQFSAFPQGLIAGSDGAMWITQEYPNQLARVTTAGVVSFVPLSGVYPQANDLAIGADGKIYVAEPQAGAIGRLSAIGGTAVNMLFHTGKQGQGTMATFIDGTPTAKVSDFTATINWGDGTRSAGVISGPTGGPFSVSGKHTYRRKGLFHLIVYLQDAVDNSTYQSTPGTAQVF